MPGEASSQGRALHSEFLAIKSRLGSSAGKDKIWPGYMCLGMGLGQNI